MDQISLCYGGPPCAVWHVQQLPGLYPAGVSSALSSHNSKQPPELPNVPRGKIIPQWTKLCYIHTKLQLFKINEVVMSWHGKILEYIKIFLANKDKYDLYMESKNKPTKTKQQLNSQKQRVKSGCQGLRGGGNRKRLVEGYKLCYKTNKVWRSHVKTSNYNW